MQDARPRQRGANTVQHRDDVGGAAGHRPGAEGCLVAVGQGADDRHGAELGRRERQHAGGIAQEDDRVARHGASGRPVRRRQDLRLLPRRVAVAVGIVEQAEPLLGEQDAAHRTIERRHRDPAGAHLGDQLVDVGLRDHLHVDAGGEGEPACLGAVGRQSVLDQLADRLPVADHEPAPAPLAAQDALEQSCVRARRHAADVVEAAHQRGDTRVHRGAEGRQVDLAESALRDIDRVVIAPGLGRAVGGEVLGAGEQRVGRVQVLALEPADPRRRHHHPEVGILAGALDDATPPGVARDVHHGGEGPVDAGRGRLDRRHPGSPLDRAGIPARGLGQRDRERRPEPVDDVEGEQERDAEARPLHRDGLQLACEVGAEHAQEGADLPLGDHCPISIIDLRPAGCVPRPLELGELAELLLDCHAGQEGFDARVTGGRRVAAGRLATFGRHGGAACESEGGSGEGPAGVLHRTSPAGGASKGRSSPAMAASSNSR